jgi:hypothetical protein
MILITSKKKEFSISEIGNIYNLFMHIDYKRFEFGRFLFLAFLAHLH